MSRFRQHVVMQHRFRHIHSTWRQFLRSAPSLLLSSLIMHWGLLPQYTSAWQSQIAFLSKQWEISSPFSVLSNYINADSTQPLYLRPYEMELQSLESRKASKFDLNAIPLESDHGEGSSRTPQAAEHTTTHEQKILGRVQFLTLCWTLFLTGWNDGTTGPLLPRIQEVYHVCCSSPYNAILGTHHLVLCQ